MIAGDPSDHLGTGIINVVMGSGLLCAANTGEPSRSAPQRAPLVCARKNMRCGCQWPTLSPRKPCLDIMKLMAPGSGAVMLFAATAALVRSIMWDFETP